jgi:late competence protein required for DNA uptake (superfamily II DNA/RNA helicase)
MSANEPVSSFSLVLGRLCFLLARVANEGKSEISGANTEERERERDMVEWKGKISTVMMKAAERSRSL